MRLFALLTAAFGAAVLAASSPAFAQSSDPPPPVHSFIDANGVDLTSGNFVVSDTYIVIGDPSQGGLAWTYLGGLIRDNYYGAINHSGSTYTVSLGDLSLSFSLSGSTFTSLVGDGSTLTQSGGTYTLTMRDGSVAIFSSTWASTYFTQAGDARVISVSTPTGIVTSYSYKRYSFGTTSGVRLQGVTNNLGYELKYFYQTSNGSASDGLVSKVMGINNAVEYCDPAADSCSPVNAWPSALINGTAVTNGLNQTTTYPAPSANATTTLSRPGGPSWTIKFDGSTRVVSASNGIGTWSYSYSVGGSTIATTVTDPLNHTRTVQASGGLVTFDTDGASHMTGNAYDGYGRLSRTTFPENGYITYTYDGRGNVTQVQSTPKSGSPLPVRTTTAGFDATCTYPAKCNKPNWSKDANQNETDYTYDNGTGLLLHLTPPGGANGQRSDTAFINSQYSAYYKNAAGSLIAGPAVWKLAATINCATATTCPQGSPNALQVNYGYGSPNTPNNLQLTINSQDGSDGSTYRQRNFTYDNVGNLQTATDWLGNVTRYRYDADRELIGMVGPDPDGSGALKNRATRYTYTNSRVTEIDQGTTASQSDADWSNFSALALQIIGYDGLGRKNQTNLGQVGSPAASITQYAYDGANRLICTAVRMNIGAALPSPCQLGATGNYGPDRITYLGYDAADRVTTTTTGYLTAAQRTESTTTYTPDGLVQTQADAKGNLTTFTYDGFDRLSQINFPTASNGSVSNGSDVLTYTYDANGNLTGRRNRDTSTVTYAYDGANRLTSRTGTTLNGISFGYDNLGRVNAAAIGSQTLVYVYDILGRRLTEGVSGTGAYTVTNQYDANDHRTRLQWPDATYATYTYDAAGELTTIKDGAGVQLSYLTYDDLGRRTANYMSGLNSCQGWSYSTDLQLSGITLQPTCGTVTQSYGYYYNAAGQLRASTSSNSAFDWSSPTGNIGRSYAVDGLNHYTTSGGVALTYDGLSNTTNDTRLGYTYDGLNKMVHISNGANFNYDALDRLQVTSGSSVTRFLYEGDTIIGEYDASGNVLQRYVPGAAKDEFAAWYKAPGSGGYAGRQYYATDRQGSVVGVYNDAKALIAINTYDESGVPGTGNMGRFSFNGAPYIPEADLLHMRARDYSFRLGRFMQTDPIGYADGLNWYNYTHSDPVNGWDPVGTSNIFSCYRLPGSATSYHGDDGAVSGLIITDGQLVCSTVYVPDQSFNPPGSYQVAGNGPTPAQQSNGLPSAEDREKACAAAERDDAQARQYAREALAYGGGGLLAGELPPLAAALEAGAALSEGMGLLHSARSAAFRYYADHDLVPAASAAVGYLLGRASGLKGVPATAGGMAGDAVSDFAAGHCGAKQ